MKGLGSCGSFPPCRLTKEGNYPRAGFSGRVARALFPGSALAHRLLNLRVMDKRIFRFSMPFFLGVCLAFPSFAEKQPAQKPSPAVQDFLKRVERYADLRNSLEKKLQEPGDKAEPEEIRAHQLALAELIRGARSEAKEGDVLCPEAVKELKQVLKSEFQGAGGKTAKATVKESAPAPFECKVNQAYPANAPVSTVPPDVLLKLPQLPEDIEYRFVGSNLILRDVRANIVVDCAREITSLS